MKRFLLFVLGWLSLGAPFASTWAATATNLHLFIWSEYMDPQVLRDFEQKYACRVVSDFYEDAESMLAKLQRGGKGLYDVVVPPDYLIPTLARLKLLAPLRHERLTNLTNLDLKFLNPPYDPQNRFSVAYQWGTLGIYLRRQPGTPVEPTWRLIFEPATNAPPTVLMDSMRDLIGAALKYQGHSLNSVDPAELKAARDLILNAKKHCVAFDGSVGAKNKVLAKTAGTALVYSGEGTRGMAQDPETQYLLPREGGLIWVDNLAVVAEAPQRDLAEAFIDFLLEPQASARISNHTRFSNPNRAARPFLRREDAENPTLYPPPDVMNRLELVQDLGAKTRLYDEIWTQIKAR